jgi:hypothetical protein
LAFKALMESKGNTDALAFARTECLAEMDRRKKGTDAFTSQVKGAGGGDGRYDGAIMLALNSSWDSAALGLHAIFKNNHTWIVETVRWLLEHTQSPVIVRQHPVERLEMGRTSDDYRMLLETHFGVQPRLHFIAAADKINSYDLMARVDAIVVHSSTIGLEAASHGVPVLTASNSYYSDLGFVFRAKDLDDYHELLGRAAARKLDVSEDMKVMALTCYYLTQCCNWIFSDFCPSDFHAWIRQPLDHWYGEKDVKLILETIQAGVPVATLNHGLKYSNLIQVG